MIKHEPYYAFPLESESVVKRCTPPIDGHGEVRSIDVGEYLKASEYAKHHGISYANTLDMIEAGKLPTAKRYRRGYVMDASEINTLPVEFIKQAPAGAGEAKPVRIVAPIVKKKRRKMADAPKPPNQPTRNGVSDWIIIAGIVVADILLFALVLATKR